MRYIDYAIKYIIRRIIRMIFKPKFLVVILIILLSFFVFKNHSQAYQGDNSYTDKNNTINLSYNGVNSDLINRLSNSSSQSVTTIKEKLKDNNLAYYVYWGAYDGSSMLSGNTFDRNTLCIAFFPLSTTTTTAPGFDVYMGMQTSIISITGAEVYYFEGNNIEGSFSDRQVYLPGVLFGYRNIDLVNYINSSSQQQTDSIVSAVQDTTNSVNQLETTIKEQDEDKSSSDINSTFESVNSSTSEFSSDVTSIVDFFKSLHDVIQSAVNSVGADVITVNIGLPFVDKTIVLRSDIIEKHINPSILYTLVQLSYVVAFGYYIVLSVFNTIEWVVSGEMITGVRLQHKNLIMNTLFK